MLSFLVRMLIKITKTNPSAIQINDKNAVSNSIKRIICLFENPNASMAPNSFMRSEKVVMRLSVRLTKMSIIKIKDIMKN